MVRRVRAGDVLAMRPGRSHVVCPLGSETKGGGGSSGPPRPEPGPSRRGCEGEGGQDTTCRSWVGAEVNTTRKLETQRSQTF